MNRKYELICHLNQFAAKNGDIKFQIEPEQFLYNETRCIFFLMQGLILIYLKINIHYSLQRIRTHKSLLKNTQAVETKTFSLTRHSKCTGEI